jgi:hypothetical protein
MSSFFGRNLGGSTTPGFPTTGTSFSSSSSSTSSGLQPVKLVKPIYYRSVELEKLLNSFGNLSSSSINTCTSTSTNNTPSSTAQYDAEVMIDELLASTWKDNQGKSNSTNMNTSGDPPSSKNTNRTKASMSDLQNVLSDAIEKLLKHRQVISERIQTLEKENQKAAHKYQETLKSPELLLTVSIDCILFYVYYF